MLIYRRETLWRDKDGNVLGYGPDVGPGSEITRPKGDTSVEEETAVLLCDMCERVIRDDEDQITGGTAICASCIKAHGATWVAGVIQRPLPGIGG